jgi:hypothetical protein
MKSGILLNRNPERDVHALPESHRKVLEALAARQFATEGQLEALCAMKQPFVNRTLRALEDNAMVEAVHMQSKPYVYCLAARGAAALAINLPSGGRDAAWPVIAHACNRNAFEIKMREQYPRFRFLTRLSLLKQGLFPARGDHAALIDDTATTWYVILDDWQMPPRTLVHRWTREHARSLRHAKPGPARRWRDVANRFIVACTDSRHAEDHRRVITEQKLPAEVVVFEGPWSKQRKGRTP